MENIPGFSNVSRGYLDFHAFSPAKDSDKELFCLPLGTLERRSGEKAGILKGTEKVRSTWVGLAFLAQKR